jgi:hypothetical protein
VNSEFTRVISVEEFDSGDSKDFSDQVISVCSGIYSIFAKSIYGYQPGTDESLAPNLLNYSIQNQETHEFLWHDWRFAVDSPEIYLRVKDQISRQD